MKPDKAKLIALQMALDCHSGMSVRNPDEVLKTAQRFADFMTGCAQFAPRDVSPDDARAFVKNMAAAYRG